MTERLGRPAVAPLLPSEEDVATLAPLISAVGPLALVRLVCSGPPERRSSEILEIAILLLGEAGGEAGGEAKGEATGNTPGDVPGNASGRGLDEGAPQLSARHSLIRPLRGPSTEALDRMGLAGAALSQAPSGDDLREELEEALGGRTWVVHDASSTRAFLERSVPMAARRSRMLDLQELQALVHPDAPDLALATLTNATLHRPAAAGGSNASAEEVGPPATAIPRPTSPSAPGALGEVVGLLRTLIALSQGARSDAPRYRNARQALERHLPTSPWIELLGNIIIFNVI